MKVLLVCALPRVAVQVTTVLVDAQFTQVGTPQRALALLDAGETFDVIVADNDTRPSGGFHLSREVKARAQMGATMPPVMLLLARDQDRFLANWSQADAYMVKPIDPFDLEEVVRSLAGGLPVPSLPRVGGEPTASPFDVPGPADEEPTSQPVGGLTWGGP